MARRRKDIPTEPVEAEISSLTHEGRGLTHIDGKTVFVDGALAGERVRFRYRRIQRHYDEATLLEVLRPAPDRVLPKCAHFGVCGGCSLQHLSPDAQLRVKQEGLEDVLRRIGKVAPERWLAPLQGPLWGYRRKARLGVRYVPKKGGTLIGFRERSSALLADLQRCEVLHPTVGERLTELRAGIDRLRVREQLPQIEVAVGDDAVVLVLRVLQPPGPEDLASLQDLAAATGLHLYLQEGGAETIRPLPGQAVDLSFSLPSQDLRLGFLPTDFTQVNLELNRAMVDQAVALLDPQPQDAVLDLFCGLGNFTLPLARHAARVDGVEGDAGLVERARANARRNGIATAHFWSADLYGELTDEPWLQRTYRLALLDPPRSGALQVLEQLPRLAVERLLYVSCYPATLARDAERLVHGLGYRLRAAGVMDMFPHTSHVESMALFERA